jgi:HEAT repeat protein
MVRSFFWIVIVIVSLLSGSLFAQDDLIPQDSVSFHQFLVLQGEVPGVGYRFTVEGRQLPEAVSKDSTYLFLPTKSGFQSQVFADFQQADFLDHTLADLGLNYRLEYVLLANTAGFAAVREFVAERARSGDYLIRKEAVEPLEDLVLLASNSPYNSTQKLRMRLASDYRLFAVTVTIILFFVVEFVMIIGMLVIKAGRNKKETLQKEYSAIIIDPLTSLLFEKEIQDIKQMDEAEIDTYFPASLRAKLLFQFVLIESIISLNKKMKGEFKEKLKALFKKLELDKIAIKSLYHRKWDRTATALVYINEMDLVEALPEVKNFTDARNFHVRSLAVATLLNLSEKVDLVFLRDQTYPLSLWQQMNYLRIIRFVRSHKDLKLQILFDSKNPSIRIFGIKLVRILGRIDLIEALETLAKNAPDDEKIEVLETYAALGAYMESGFINECLRSSNPLLSMAAAKAAGAVGDSESADILIELIKGEVGFRSRMRYLKALYGVDPERFSELTLSEAHPELRELRDHILDPLLQNV